VSRTWPCSPVLQSGVERSSVSCGGGEARVFLQAGLSQGQELRICLAIKLDEVWPLTASVAVLVRAAMRALL